MTKNRITMSPGEILQQELANRGMNNTHLAELLGRSAQYVTDIIKGKKAMDVDLAIQLELALGGQPKATYWMNAAVEHYRARAKPTRVAILAKHPFAKQMVKLKWIDGTLPLEELDESLQNFWDLEEKVVVNFKRSASNLAVNDAAKRAWTIEVYRRAMRQECPQYDKTRFPELLADLQNLMDDEAKVGKALSTIQKYGIRVVILPNPEKCPVDGVASFNDGCPYLGLSMRIARLDSFWFALMHELMHIYNEDSRMPADTIDRIPANDRREQKANEMARNALMSDKDYKAFVDTGVFTFSAIETAAKAGHHPIHASILLGRLKNDLYLDWSQFAREHPGVRDLVLQAVTA